MTQLFSQLTVQLTAIFELGGPVVALLGVLSVLSIAMVLFKLWQFRRARLGRHGDILRALDHFDHSEQSRAQTTLAKSQNFLAPTLITAIHQREICSDPSSLRQRHASLLAYQLDGLERGFRILETIAMIAPLLGLFGTVLGMIDAFRALQSAGSAVDPSILAGGIWVALMTTATGLAVAMPTQVILTWFQSRMERERGFADTALERVFCPTYPTSRANAALPTQAAPLGAIPNVG
jgi:biopolymer transport protein ExbB